MHAYQLFVRGCSAVFDSEFKMYSKKIFRNEPSKEDKDEFVKLCADKTYLNYLDTSKEYEIKVLTLDFVEN